MLTTTLAVTATFAAAVIDQKPGLPFDSLSWLRSKFPRERSPPHSNSYGHLQETSSQASGSLVSLSLQQQIAPSAFPFGFFAVSRWYFFPVFLAHFSFQVVIPLISLLPILLVHRCVSFLSSSERTAPPAIWPPMDVIAQ